MSTKARSRVNFDLQPSFLGSSCADNRAFENVVGFGRNTHIEYTNVSIRIVVGLILNDGAHFRSELRRKFVTILIPTTFQPCARFDRRMKRQLIHSAHLELKGVMQ